MHVNTRAEYKHARVEYMQNGLLAERKSLQTGPKPIKEHLEEL